MEKTHEKDLALVALGKRIKAAREAAGLSQKQVGDHFDIVVSTVSRWETGDGDPGTGRLTRLAELFRVPASSLAFGEAPPAAEAEDEPKPNGASA